MSSLLDRLRSETHPFHEQTERLLYSDALRGGTLSPDEYRHLLLTHAAYHKSLEQAIDRFPDFFDAYDPGARRKTPWLQNDLDELQLTRTPSIPPAFTDWSPVELLGAAYVGEGSMLGGKTVWHYLQQSSAIQPLLHNARFYRGYGPETGARWKDFGLFIARKADGQADQVVEAAGRAFRAYQVLFAQTRSDVRQGSPR
jgi:heme oxygenase (biliverdin-IX-beta and delta-forming)